MVQIRGQTHQPKDKARRTNRENRSHSKLKDHKKILYVAGMISLVGLPALFFMFFNNPINDALNKRSIEMNLPPIVDGSMPFPYVLFPKSRNVAYTFGEREEQLEIDTFRVYYQFVQQQYPGEIILYELKIGKSHSYGFFINVLDVIGYGMHGFILYNDLLYIVSHNKEGVSQYVASINSYRENYFVQIKSTFLKMTITEQGSAIVILLLWLFLALFAFSRIKYINK